VVEIFRQLPLISGAKPADKTLPPHEKPDAPKSLPEAKP
jgi:hypothetical protein